MNRKQLVLEYRTTGKLKGHKAVVVNLNKNIGKIYNGTTANFIMTLGKEKIYFQRLSLFTRKLLPDNDFSLNINRIKSYHLREHNFVTNCLTLYTVEKYFLEIYYNTKSPDTYDGEQNILSIIKKLQELGIKDLYDEGTDN